MENCRAHNPIFLKVALNCVKPAISELYRALVLGDIMLSQSTVPIDQIFSALKDARKKFLCKNKKAASRGRKSFKLAKL